jgi:hypothetical protein
MIVLKTTKTTLECHMKTWKYVPVKVKLTLSVRVAVWIRESGSGPPTHVRANREPAASRAPLKALASPAELGRARLVAPHIQTSLAHWDASQARTCMGTFTHRSPFIPQEYS